MENSKRYINDFSARRSVPSLRYIAGLAEIIEKYRIIFLAGGLPNEKVLPFSRIRIQCKEELNEDIVLEGKDLQAAFQYSSSEGYGPLQLKLKELQTRVHKLGSTFWEKNDLVITCGNLDAISKALLMCIEPGDPVIFQEPCYSGIIDVVRPYNPRFIAAPEDDEGLCPRRLKEALEAEGPIDMLRNKTRGIPKILYVNPTGSNPSGKTISTERKKEIYRLACEYDLLILEDDPYYFLHFDEINPVSFLSMDTENRVLRFDSFSKILCSGLRLSFTTGPKTLIQKIILHQSVTTMHASTLPQVIVDKLLASWKPTGVDHYFSMLRHFYRKQRDAALEAAEKHLKDLADWTVPRGGMFLWLKIRGQNIACTVEGKKALAHRVLTIHGKAFMLHDNESCPFVRVSFSQPTPQELDMGLARLACLLKNAQ